MSKLFRVMKSYNSLEKHRMLRSFINSQRWLSRKLDKLLPIKYRTDGNRDYLNSLVPKYLEQNLTIYDIGGGKTPYLSPSKKKTLCARVFGLDIDQEELSRAPLGAYDEIICADITKFRGNHEADIVICQTLLEHVSDVESAFKAIESILKPGGLALLFVPSRNAVFARLNIILPQNLKKFLLHTIFPNTKQNQGFPSYYDKCTPSEFLRMASSNNLMLVESRFYYISTYFSFFFPAYLVWRLWVLLFHSLLKEQAAETFSMVFRKGDG
jgi:2-polyprenyl-3-methyl-5-hydroxy-6-metoxy-1,4-benzoquinol methylase